MSQLHIEKKDRRLAFSLASRLPTVHNNTFSRLPMALNILIVDDEQSMRDFLKILLQKEGYKVVTAENADTGFQALQEDTFDLVISDIRMPGASGLELLEKIKDHNPNIPVIMITAFASPDDAVSAMKNGAFDYISKTIQRR